MLHVVNDIVNTEEKRQKDLTILTRISFYLNTRTQVFRLSYRLRKRENWKHQQQQQATSNVN